MIMNQKTNVIIVSSNSERYYVFGFILFFNISVIIGIGIALILEFVMNIYYCDNDHECYEILVRKDIIIQDHVILLCNCCNDLFRVSFDIGYLLYARFWALEDMLSILLVP